MIGNIINYYAVATKNDSGETVFLVHTYTSSYIIKVVTLWNLKANMFLSPCYSSEIPDNMVPFFSSSEKSILIYYGCGIVGIKTKQCSIQTYGSAIWCTIVINYHLQARSNLLYTATDKFIGGRTSSEWHHYWSYVYCYITYVNKMFC